MGKCLRKDLKENCPYVEEKSDVPHGYSREDIERARSRVNYLCQSTPCSYSIEKLIKELTNAIT